MFFVKICVIIFKEEKEHMAQKENSLEILAPTLLQRDKTSVDKAYLFIDFLAKNARTAISQIQCDDLKLVWQAFGKAYSVNPNSKLDSVSMNQLFNESSDLLRVIQTQQPIVTDCYRGDWFTIALRERFPNEKQQKEWQISRMDVNLDGSICAYGDEHNYRSDFYFIRATYPDHEDHKNIVAVPVVHIDPDLTRNLNLEDIDAVMDGLKTLITIANHDYYHQISGRLMIPYFGDGMNIIHFNQTPYAQAHKVSWFSDPEECDSEAYYGDVVRHKQSSEGAWAFLSPDGLGYDSYEYNAAFMHAHLYQNHLHEGEKGIQMYQAIDVCVAGIKGAMKKCALYGYREQDQLFGFYFSVIMKTNIARLVPFDHPLMMYLDEQLAQLPLEADFCKQQSEKRNSGISYEGEELTALTYLNGFISDLLEKNIGYIHSDHEGAVKARAQIMDLSHEMFTAIEKDFTYARAKQKVRPS